MWIGSQDEGPDVTSIKASEGIPAPPRAAKTAIAAAHWHDGRPAGATDKPAATKSAGAKPVAKAAPKPAAAVMAKPAPKAAAPKTSASKTGARAAPVAVPLAAPAKPAVKMTALPAKLAAPAPAAPVKLVVQVPVPPSRPMVRAPVAQAAAAPSVIKVAPAEPSDAPPAARPERPAMSASARHPNPPPVPPPLPGHLDRRPGQIDRNPPRPPSKAEIFVEGDYVVYPTHGVGKVERIATEEIAGHRLELIHITFEENRMTLRVPVAKARSAGLRKLATRKLFDEAMALLKGRARIKRTMWSRRAQEYEAKINSGDPLAIAEVVRDLHRNAGQPDQSFSERQIYEAALDRLAAELAALDKTDKPTAVIKLGDFLKTVA